MVAMIWVSAAVFGIEPLQLHQIHGQLKLTGVLTAAAGAILTVYWASHSSTPPHLRGLLAADETPSSQLIIGYGLLVTQCVCGACYQLVQKHLLSTADYPPLAVAAFGYVVGAMAIGLMLPVCKLDPEAWTFLGDSTNLIALTYAILMTSAFNYALSAFANKHSSPTLVTAFFPMQIVFTAIFSWIALGTVPTAGDYVGSALIVCGLAGVTLGRVIHTRHVLKTRTLED